MKCSHGDNRGNECEFLKCPRSGFEVDWFLIKDICRYSRSDKWIPKEEKEKE